MHHISRAHIWLSQEIRRHQYLPHLLVLFCSSLVFLSVSSGWRPSFADEAINSLKKITGNFWTLHTLGSFSPTGNAGMITLPATDSGSELFLDSSANTFSGWLFSETVGWIQVGVSGYPVTMIPPDENVLDPWTLSGVIWSENAGWITLNALDSSYSWVYYLPISQTFTGSAWSDTLGYLDFGQTAGLTDGLLGKVKILGNRSGDTGYDAGINGYTIDKSLTSSSIASLLGEIRKNVALTTRNLPSSKINTSASTDISFNDIKYYKLNGEAVNITNARFIAPTRTIVVEGWDVYMSGDSLEETVGVNHPRAIIVLKNASGSGGNVYIDGGVKKIQSTIIAEGNILSGKKTASSTTLYNDTKTKATNLPQNQLYIIGTLVSRNTIGWATTSGLPGCPYGITETCTRESALKYDFNYFRAFDQTDPHRSYLDSSLDDYSMILQYDTRVLSDPPPIVKTVSQ